MKILHIGATAGVPFTLAKYQRENGYEADVIHWGKLDGFKLKPEADYITTVSSSIYSYYIKVLRKIRHYDLIHIHSADKLLKYLRIFYNKPVVLTYHGTDIRGRWEERSKYWKLADAITVVTKDLLCNAPENTMVIENTYDGDKFKRDQDYIKNTALLMNVNNVEMEKVSDRWAKIICEENGLVLIKSERIFPHAIYPKYLELFEYYLENKYDPNNSEPLNVLSLNAIEFLGMGGKVITMYGNYSEVPTNHMQKCVVMKYIGIYNGVM